MIALVDNVVVGLEHTVREPVVAYELPNVFNRVEFRRVRRQWQNRNVSKRDQIFRQMRFFSRVKRHCSALSLDWKIIG